MHIRPLSPDTTTTFAQVCGRSEHAADVQRYLDQMLERGAIHPDWCFVAEEAHQIVGTIAYWALPSSDKPSDFVLIELPWEREDWLSLGTQLLQHTLSHMRELGVHKIGHVLDTPPMYPQWQQFPAQRSELLTHLGFTLQRETYRFEWLAGETAPAGSQRLTFRSLTAVGDIAFIDVIEQASAGTLDRSIRQEREQGGPAHQAREMFKDLQQMEYDPAWWQLAYTQTGDLVGFVMPTKSPGAAVIGYIGVLPHQRGHGYINDLLLCTATTFYAAGERRIVADTDVDNAPMANAFRRAGYRQFATRKEYAIHLS